MENAIKKFIAGILAIAAFFYVYKLLGHPTQFIGQGVPLDQQSIEKTATVTKTKAGITNFIQARVTEKCKLTVEIGQGTSTDVVIESTGSPSCQAKGAIKAPLDQIETDAKYKKLLTDEYASDSF